MLEHQGCLTDICVTWENEDKPFEARERDCYIGEGPISMSARRGVGVEVVTVVELSGQGDSDYQK